MSRTATASASSFIFRPDLKTVREGNHRETNFAEPDRYEMVDLEGSFLPKSSLPKNKSPFVRFFESSLLGGIVAGKSSKNDAEREMEELSGRAVKIVSNTGGGDIVAGFDICREYSYSGDEHDRNGPTPALVESSMASSSLNMLDSEGGEAALMTYVLGRAYHPIHGLHARRDDESSLFWFTYRCDFPDISPYNITSDAGWGCMLRSAQMMLAQALRMHYKSRGWRPVHLLTRRRQDPFVRSLLTWFADFPSSSENVYSLHNMVAAGLAKYDKLPGEWYGPGTACYVIRDLVDMHARQLSAKAVNKQVYSNQPHLQQQQQQTIDQPLFRVHVASQALVCRDEIEALMTRDSKARLEEARREKEKESQPQHPLDHAWEEELIESVDSVTWDTALLLLIPLRLGLKSFNEDYVQAVAHTFSMPQSVGVLGGRPRGARWFYGAVADGSRVLGLDPHTVQTAPRKRSARVNGKVSSVVDLSDDYLRSVHTTYAEVFSLSKMDPSIALAFYCRNRRDLEAVFSSLAAWKQDHVDAPPDLFNVVDAAPDYSANVSSSTMDDMFLGGSNTANSFMTTTSKTSFLIDACDDDDYHPSEDDEYVML